MYNCGQDFIFIHIPRTGGTSIVSKLLEKNLLTTSQYNYTNDHIRIPQTKCREYIFSFVRNPFDRLVSIYKWLDQGVHNNSIHRKTGSLKLHTTFQDWFYWRYVDKDHNWFTGYEKSNNFVKIFPEHLQLDYTILQYANFGFESQFYMLSQEDTKEITCDFVGKFENLNNDWKTVSKQINCEVDLPHWNKTESDSYKLYYNTEMKNLVFKHYENDFNIFNYDW